MGGSEFGIVYVGNRVAPGFRMRCRNCGDERYPRPSGLCAKCYRNPEIRRQYPRSDRFTPSELGLKEPTEHGEPTTVLPGEDKVPVLMERAARGLFLFHPQDAGAA